MKILKKHVKNVFLQLDCNFPIYGGGVSDWGVSDLGCVCLMWGEGV